MGPFFLFRLRLCGALLVFQTAFVWCIAWYWWGGGLLFRLRLCGVLLGIGGWGGVFFSDWVCLAHCSSHPPIPLPPPQVAPPIAPFTCLRACLEKFTPHNIEVAAALLETCGRWLFRTPHTHQRTARMLDAMMRIKRVRACVRGGGLREWIVD